MTERDALRKLAEWTQTSRAIADMGMHLNSLQTCGLADDLHDMWNALGHYLGPDTALASRKAPDLRVVE